MVDEDLEPLITRCPNCATQFRVTESQLAAAGGRVRCGACLTVFEGTEHLILDDDTTFDDGVDADAALDALLDELGTSEAPDADLEAAPTGQEEPALTQDTPVIYGGFENESRDERGDGFAEGDAKSAFAAAEAAASGEAATVPESRAPEATGYEALVSEPAEDWVEQPGETRARDGIGSDDHRDSPAPDQIEAAAESEAESEAGSQAESHAEAPQADTQTEAGSDPRSETPVAAPEESEPAEDITSEEEAGSEAAGSEEAGPEEAAPRDVAPGSVLEADYKAWIQSGASDIDQLVEQVVASGTPAREPATDETPDPAEAPDRAGVGDGFHLSAVEKSLAEEGVGTSPISFAPEPRRWWVVGVAALLSVLLAAQIFYLQLPEWSRDPGTRGIYETVCGLFGCELPEIRDLDGLRTRNLMVRSHPDLENALVIDAVIVNQAGFEQRFPGLQLRFTSVGGLLVAGRIFQPEEYLAGEMGPGDLMPVDTPVRVTLEIADPGEEAVNYTLSFR